MPTNLNAKNLQILGIQLFRLWQVYIILSDDERCDYLQRAVAYFMFLFQLHALYMQTKVSFRQVNSIQQEINYTRKQTSFFKSAEDIQSRFEHVHPVPDHPTKWYYTNRHYSGAYYALEMHADSDELIKQVEVFSSLSVELKNQFSAARKAKSPSHIPEPPGTYAPAIQLFLKCFPFHCSAGIDMPSKNRFYHISIAVIYAASYLFGLNIRIPSFLMAVYRVGATGKKDELDTGLIIFNFFLALYEAKLLNEQTKQLAFMGIQRRVTPYFAFPPTCYGRQIMAQHFFVGQNNTLHWYVAFLVEMSDFIRELEQELRYDDSIVNEITILPACIQARQNLKKILHMEKRKYDYRFDEQALEVIKPDVVEMIEKFKEYDKDMQRFCRNKPNH